MDKFKIKILPNKKVIIKVCSNILSMAIIIGIIMFMSSCSDDIFLFGYNKDLEELSQSMFEADSLIRTMQMNLDSLHAKGY